MNKIIFIILIFFMSSAVCFAGPSVSSTSGTWAHGNNITISGSDFTTKSQAEPIKWETFEGETDGNGIDDDAFWTCKDSSSDMEISTLNNRGANSTRTAEAHAIWSTRSAQCWKNAIGFTTTGKIYVNLWIRVDTPNDNDDTSVQFKSWRVPASVTVENGSTNYPDIAAFDWFYSASQSYYYQNHGSVSTGYFGGYTYDHEDEKWYNVALQLDMGTAGGADGRWIGWNSSADAQYEYNVQDDFWPDESYEILGAGNDDINAFYMMNYLGNAEDDTNEDAWVKYYYDDIYIDNVWNRVEIGDNSTYSSCTHREIQPPTSWATDEITITVNEGGISDLTGGGWYLFVIDSDGTASSGYQITSGGDDPSPTGETTFSGGASGGGSF